MDITYKDKQFRIKGKNGILYSTPELTTIESQDGASKKEITEPGEYEVAGISVVGIANETGPVFVYEVDGLRICNLGKTDKKLADNKVSAVGDIDILLLPKATESVELMQQIESYYVIPFGFAEGEELEKFLKEASITVEKTSKLSIKKDELVEDSTAQIVVLTN